MIKGEGVRCISAPDSWFRGCQARLFVAGFLLWGHLDADKKAVVAGNLVVRVVSRARARRGCG